MGWDFCNTKTVKKTKKDHHCEFCGRVIPKGSQNIFNWSGKFDGELVNCYGCHWCIANEDKLVDGEEILDFWDCLYEDIFYDKIKELKESGNSIVINFDSEDSDWLIFIDDDTGEIVHKEYMPVVNK
jgi:hypothetical protein